MASDAPLPEDAEIAASHPLRIGRHDLYAEAMRLVGARRSKGGLVELACWLLTRVAKAEKRHLELLVAALPGSAFMARSGMSVDSLHTLAVDHVVALQKVHESNGGRNDG